MHRHLMPATKSMHQREGINTLEEDIRRPKSQILEPNNDCQQLEDRIGDLGAKKEHQTTVENNTTFEDGCEYLNFCQLSISGVIDVRGISSSSKMLSRAKK